MQPELVNPNETGLMGAVSELAHRLHLPTTFVKFAIVGGIGFIVGQFVIFLVYDLSLLWFLPSEERRLDLGWFTPEVRYLISTVLAVETAIVVQFVSHERWTFRRRPQSGRILRRFTKFNISAGVGAIIIVITATLFKSEFSDIPTAFAPYVSFAIGVAIGFSWNWTMNSLVIWPILRQTSTLDQLDDADAG